MSTVQVRGGERGGKRRGEGREEEGADGVYTCYSYNAISFTHALAVL